MTDPTELDRLDPPPRPPRRLPRRKGEVEKAVLASLTALKVSWRTDGIAAATLVLARQLDEGGMNPRDAAGHAAQIRQALAQFREWNPAGQTGDATDAAQSKSESARALYVVE